MAVQGISPAVWSAWVVPRQGMPRRAWAQATAYVEWLWQTPRMPSKER